MLLDKKIAEKEEREEQQQQQRSQQDPEAKKYFSEIDNMISVIVKPRELLNVDLGILSVCSLSCESLASNTTALPASPYR